MTKYKKHLRSGFGTDALCGCHTTASKLVAAEWVKLPASDRCPMCELAATIGPEPGQPATP
jgi:hypothetical protein